MPLVRIRVPLGYLTVYLAAIALGRLSIVEGTTLALFWPAAGVSALWMLRGATRRQVVLDALVLFASTTVFFLLLDKGVASVLFGVANLVQGFAVRIFVAGLGKRPLTGPQAKGVITSRGLLRLGVASLGASIVSYPFALLGLWVSSGHWALVSGWVIRNSCGTFVIAGAALTILGAYRTRPDRVYQGVLTTAPRSHSRLELVAATVATLGSALVVFAAPAQLPIAYVMIAASVWIGFRFSPSVGAVHSLAFGTLALLCTFAGWGPFGTVADPMSQAIVVQLFVAVTAMIVLILSFGSAERHALTDQLRASEAKAMERAELMDAVTKVMADGLSVIDAHGTVLLNNPAAERMVGLGRPGVQVLKAHEHGVFDTNGTPVSDEVSPGARALRGETVPPTDLLRVDPTTGLRSTLSISASPLRPPVPGEVAVAVIAIRDVTKVRANRRELENFAGVVAHDLKSPLTGVVSWAEILDDQLHQLSAVDTTALRESVQRIRGSADRMAVLISDLLAYTQAQDATLSMQPVDLDEMVDQIALDLGETHHAEVPVIEHAPLGRVLADRTLMRQLLTNVIGNAVKYVAPGVIPHIVIGAAPVDDMLEVWVSDNGIGIPDKDLGHVFDSFFRAAGSTQDYPGTGLGLAICARTVERHGGRISARKGLGGQGTSMIFTLPLDKTVVEAEVPTDAQVELPVVALDLERLSATS